MSASTVKPRCIDCKGEVIYGEPFHQSRATSYSKIGVETVTEYRCHECSDQYARDLWPDDFGPCPHLRMKEGHA